MAVDGELPWTTSRCNRLLRPLSSKLAKLRKVLELPRSDIIESRNASSAFHIRRSPQKTTSLARLAPKPRGFEKARDPDWKPGANKKTYGGRAVRRIALQRGSSDAGNSFRPGEIAFTPLIARTAGQLHSSPQLQNSPLKKFSRNKGPLFADIDSGLAQNMPGDLQKVIQGLLEAYANLLQATTTGDEKRWNGTRSLLGACLRQMPAYIELEEHFAKLDRLEEEQDEDRDVANEIYKHLEAQFEQEIGQGWRPFKQVARAHGTFLLCEAIADKVLGVGSLSVLVTRCLNLSAWDEAERLLLAYVPYIEPLSFPVNTKADLFDPQRSVYLSLVKAFIDRTGRHRLLYDLLDHMVALELLPLEWLATESIRPIWDRLVRTISDGDSRTLANAFQFMETITLASAGLPDERLLENEVTGSIARRFVPSSREELREALNTTFSSLLTVLCSIALVNNNRDDTIGEDITRRISWAFDAIVVAFSSRQDTRAELKVLGADPANMQVFAQRALWANFCPLLFRLDGCHRDGKIIALDSTALIWSTNWTAAQYSFNSINYASILASLPLFIASIAHGTGRIWKDDGFDQLQRSVTALMTISGGRLPHKLWTLKRLALECATEFAHSTGDTQHMAYAREIENRMQLQGRLVIVHSPEKDDSPSSNSGFRWEEGIGEWVACTPFVKQGMRRITRKPLRTLELLPTPVQSEDEKLDSSLEDELPESYNSPSQEVAVFDSDGEDDAIPRSSPIKKIKRISTSSLGKRTRASSPVVVIPAKRMYMTPPDTPAFEFYPLLPEEKDNAAGPRRSRRSRQDIEALASRLRTQRSRTSLESGLRNIQRATYVEIVPDDSDMETCSSSEQDTNSSCSSTEHTRSKSSGSHQPPKTSMHLRRRTTEANDTDERDELGKTPARPQPKHKRTSKRLSAPGQREWWKVRGGLVSGYDDDEASEDELSFH